MTEPDHPCLVIHGIALIDEPAHVNVTTFGHDGTVMLTFNTRDGGDLGQIMIGLSPNQTVELIRRLHAFDDLCLRAIASGKGGASFPDKGPG